MVSMLRERKLKGFAYSGPYEDLRVKQ